MSDLEELERELGPRLRAAYREHLPLPHPDSGRDLMDRHTARPSGRRSLAVVGVAAGLVVLLAGGLMWTEQRDGARTVATTVVGSVPATTVPPETTASTSPTTSTLPRSDSPPLSRTLTNGLSGPDVQMVQERLAELGFFVGPADGVYGGLSIQAVWAFEKLVLGTPRGEATGSVTPAMWERMADDLVIEPRRVVDGRHVEIYLPEQVMVVFDRRVPLLIAHISTGELVDGATGFTPWYDTAVEYCDTVTIDADSLGDLLPEAVVEARCGRSYTPPGDFAVQRIVEGQRRGALGEMWNPVYINQGIAIHGALNVPQQPASRGTIRVSQLASETLPELVSVGDPVAVWDGVTVPWAQPPEVEQMRFDYPDPNGSVIAVIDIPATDTEQLFVVPMNDPDDMKRGPAWNPASDPVGSGGVIHIIGYRTAYGAPFFDLDQLDAGDVIELRTESGQMETYIVRSNSVVERDAEIAELDESSLVLDTQEPKYTNRSTRRVIASLRP
ncbi:MAG: sortase [Ilumatobacter fluminis]|uniref:sortase domain-containing protein n=1 Tax=Ilumatobacter fluminis TaxID=467091 RepID=UPI0032EF232B